MLSVGSDSCDKPDDCPNADCDSEDATCCGDGQQVQFFWAPGKPVRATAWQSQSVSECFDPASLKSI